MSQPIVTLGTKASNATYRAKATVDPDGVVEVVPDSMAGVDHDLLTVQIAWYDDRLKIKLMGAAPVAISQAYLTGAGKDVIVEFIPVTED